MRAQDVLGFWFDLGRTAWFRKDPALDEQIRERFLPVYEAAAAGMLESWLEEPRGALAYVVLLDQFPRAPLPRTRGRSPPPGASSTQVGTTA